MLRLTRLLYSKSYGTSPVRVTRTLATNQKPPGDTHKIWPDLHRQREEYRGVFRGMEARGRRLRAPDFLVETRARQLTDLILTNNPPQTLLKNAEYDALTGRIACLVYRFAPDERPCELVLNRTHTLLKDALGLESTDWIVYTTRVQYSMYVVKQHVY